MAVAGRELSQAASAGEELADARHKDADPSLYGGSYFGEGRDPSGDRQGRSGYASYDRVSSNADIAAYLLWRNFRVRSALDVGCATGFLVEALRELGVDARGCDASEYAVAHAAEGAQGHVALGDPTRGLPYEDGAFDLVCALEILEHLPPSAVPGALRELRRVCGALCYVTTPSFGANASGPDGHFEGKVRAERLDHYRSLGPDFTGPVPTEDLEVDADGVPVEGHLTIASFDWWTQRFAEAGFERWVEVERRLYADIMPVGLEQFWNLYVFALPGTPASLAEQLHAGKALPELGLEHPLFAHAAEVEAKRA
jgi:SAM-dependent methyltransferase